jgi:GMP synthase (glutamine-hydrolysing)
MRPDTILIFDFGSQYSHLIARRVRENKVYSEILPYDATVEDIINLSERLNIKGLILSGGPLSVYREDSPKIDKRVLELGLPVLGICYGHQLLAYMYGGVVKPAERGEYGITYVNIVKPVGVLEGLNSRERVWMSHSDAVYTLPEEFEVLAYTDNCPVAAFRHKSKPIFGIQWHPEVIHTENGMLLLRNFIFRVCGCQQNWELGDFIKRAIDYVKDVVGDGKAIIALSGGVDSTVTTVIAMKAIGKRLTAVFVDHGFLRDGDLEFVKEFFGRMDINLVIVDAKERFFNRLKGIVDPEVKRRVIGEEFIRVFEEVAERVGAEYLIQGTIYPDRIESGFRRLSDRIKSHHNVAGIPSKIKFKAIVEPLADLYKDEVREVAKRLGLPDEVVHKQPFPGPGLAVRVIGEVTPEKVEIVRRADKIVREEVERAGLHKSLWQYFAVLTNTLSTGVKGDARAYGYVVAVRIVESKDAMTANFARVPYELLERIATRIVNEIPEVVRVVYDITNKPPSTIEWE